MTLDPRLHALVGTTQVVKGDAARISASVASVRKHPDASAMQLTQALFGEDCTVFESKNGWAWIQLKRDCYVGYVRQDTLGEPGAKATHYVSNPSTWIFPKADLKSQPAQQVFLNSEVAVKEINGDYAVLESGGAIFKHHLNPLGTAETDFVSVAEKFLDVPYLWGGKTHAGIDCSGLVQTALHACGNSAPRDSDMQERELGVLLNDQKNLQRGDLIFWQGHVGIMQNATQFLHANGHFMKSTSEPLVSVAARSKPITSIRRIAGHNHNIALK